jgi:hypothetical protein
MSCVTKTMNGEWGFRVQTLHEDVDNSRPEDKALWRPNTNKLAEID